MTYDDGDIMMPEPDAENSEEYRSTISESRRRDYRRQSSLTPHNDLGEDNNEAFSEVNNRNDTINDIDVNRSESGDSIDDGDEGFGNDGDVVQYEYIHLNDSESENAAIDQASNSDDDDGEFGNENNTPGNNLDQPQPAKNHSYLPTAQPLYPEQWITAGKRRHRLSGNIVEEHDDAHVNEYNEECATEDIDASSLHCDIPEPPGGLHCRSGISCNTIIDEEIPHLTKRTTLAVFEMDDSIVLFPGALLPMRLRDRMWVSYLGAMIDDARGLYGSHQGTMEGMGEVRLVILPRIPTGTRRTRRTPVEGRGRTGRWQVNLIRLGATSLRSHARRRHTSDSIETHSDNQNGEGESTHDDIEDQDTGQRQDQPQEQPSSDGESDEDEIFHPTHKASIPADPMIGRIGTLATVVFTHEESTASSISEPSGGVVPGTSSSQLNISSPSVWRNRAGELVLTVLGTQRCRLISPVKDGKQERVPMYVIEEIHDGSVVLPPSWMVQLPGNMRSPIAIPVAEASLVKDDEIEVEHSCTDLRRGGICNAGQDNAILNLSQRTRTPAIAYRALWPWRLCQKICDIIQDTAEFQGLRDILPSAAGLCCEKRPTPSLERLMIEVVDPSAFANWVAANMPLSVNGRLDLLEMVCTVQQLKYILKKMEAKRNETILRCMNCGSAISQMRHVFSVGGSDGTTGAYVNEYGVVHQTMTLRNVDGNVVCTGPPETRDSWFPGYSWQIAHCSICSAHLGWKFRVVSKGDVNDPDRPATFWGFSSLTTDEHVKPRRVIFSPGRSILAILQNR